MVEFAIVIVNDYLSTIIITIVIVTATIITTIMITIIAAEVMRCL